MSEEHKKQRMGRKVSLCKDCLNAVRWTEESYGDVYSYKYKGIAYDKHEICSKTGKIIGLRKVVKCSHHRPRKRSEL